ncbi:hypothetical protein F5B20DRAFT_592914 [Whalleya microplaca]|nr:hypothetical protein F5B20DRAFT_592914 [Whalleya microplaca]
MCFSNKDTSDDPAPKPAQVSRPPASSSVPESKARMPSQSHRQSDYAPPAGPPPSKNNPFFACSAPPGPPPSQSNPPDSYAPPPGPPPPSNPGHRPKQHDWETAVPDTALLPPPPDFFSGYDRSPANNATEAEANNGELWCQRFPLRPSLPNDPRLDQVIEDGCIDVFAPDHFRGALARAGHSVWRGHTARGSRDACLASFPPLYQAAAHSPRATGRRKEIYYEVRILQSGTNAEYVPLALGFAAAPYPPFRLPGWHRASLAVHGDDGHKYINDRWGGKDFTGPFARGETVGLGMRFSPPGHGAGSRPLGNGAPPGYDDTAIGVEIFLTRDGVVAGSWDLHEESDRQQDLPVAGLEGANDLIAAVGVFDDVAFEIVFDPEQWLWKDHQRWD